MIRDPIAILDPLARSLGHNAGVTVEVGGNQAYTDGRVVHLPALPEAEMTQEDWRRAQGLLNHEAGHLLYTTFDALPNDALLALVLNTIEDVRTEHRFCGRYPGAAADLRLAHTSALADLEARADRLERYQQRLLALLCRLDGMVLPATLGADAHSWSERWASIHPQVLAAASTAALVPLAERILADLFAPPVLPQDTAPTPAPEASGIGQTAGAASSAAAPGGTSAPSDEIPAPVAPIEHESLLSQALRRQVNTLAAQPGHKPEQVRWCPRRDGDGSAIDDLARRTVAGLARTMALAVQAQAQSRWLPDQERGRLDPRRLHRIIHGTSRRIFRRLERGLDVSTAATLITDFSSSMQGSETVASVATTTVTKALERVRVTTEVLGFRGQVLSVVKAFTDPASVTANRLAALKGSGGTPLGEVILAAVKRLIHQDTERHVVFVVTDGQPNSIPYCADILKRCQRVGVEVIGVGISVDVAHLFCDAITIPSIDRLAPALLGQVRSVLLSSNHRRPACR